MAIEPASKLDTFYAVEDPWNYDTTPDDSVRLARLLSALPNRTYDRTLEIGCGNGFVTLNLPGKEVVGLDISEIAVEWARNKAAKRSDADRFLFDQCSLFDLSSERYGQFDLVVICGVLYPQYVGRGFSLVQIVIDRLLRKHGILASVHIDDWCPWRFPYTLLNADLSPYRQYVHRLEVMEK
ncbi:class I SAM-dependent methyltransferase [Rhizobium sp. Root483D2]|uniref:class I SAM-dependent methyltransferase n=1 Tax=Rhizobium sp. Root483D2 TaxID=1736545 RepID=UPI00138EF656|nr:class I SAM-dependent methyltransferase [Rhizobium sp. Root483D2]